MFKSATDDTIEFSRDMICFAPDIKLYFIKLAIITYLTLDINILFYIISGTCYLT